MSEKGSSPSCATTQDSSPNYGGRMKHKKFNEIFPYTYYIKNRETGIKYYGVRYANVASKKSPAEDFAIRYFSSGSLKKEFKKNPDNFEYKVCWTFDSKEEAILHEEKVIRKIYLKEDWANNSVSLANINFTKEIREKMVKARKSLVEEGITLQERAAIKMNETKRIVGEDGMTVYERASRKAAETMSNTKIDGKTLHQLRATKSHSTKSRKDKNGESIYKKAGRKVSETLKKVESNGKTVAQNRAAKNPTCQKGTEEAKLVSKKRNERFNIKLALMSEKEFEEFLEGKNPMWQNLTRKRREKSINYYRDKPNELILTKRSSEVEIT